MLASSKKVSQIPLSPKLKLIYKNFKLVHHAEYYQIYEAVSQSTNQVFSIRILDLESDFYKQNPNLAATIFVQELLRICVKYPESVLPEHFEILNHNISFVTNRCCPISQKNEEIAIDIEKMICRVLSDVNFLIHDMKLTDFVSIDLENIYTLNEKQGYLLSDWARFLPKKTKDTRSVGSLRIQPGSDEINEVYLLGIRTLQLNGISKENLEPLLAIKIAKMHNAAIDSVIEGLSQPKSVKRILRKMLEKDAASRLKLDKYAEEISDFKEESKTFSRDSGSSKEGKSSATSPLKYTDTQPFKETVISADRQTKQTKLTKLESFKCIQPAKKEYYTVNRFTKQVGGWICYGKVDAITFKCSKNIQLLGVGLYVPKSSVSLTGKLQIIEGENAKQDPLVTKDVFISEDMSTLEDKIYSLMFEKGIPVKAGALFTILCQLAKGPSFNGVNGMETIVCEEGNMTFTFSKNAASTNGTDVSNGQIPELFYSF